MQVPAWVTRSTHSPSPCCNRQGSGQSRSLSQRVSGSASSLYRIFSITKIRWNNYQLCSIPYYHFAAHEYTAFHQEVHSNTYRTTGRKHVQLERRGTSTTSYGRQGLRMLNTNKYPTLASNVRLKISAYVLLYWKRENYHRV
jgi:hypothetical protein